MKVAIFSIGERTTQLCKWSLERNGFKDIVVYQDNTSLWDKLNRLYHEFDEDILRVDADVVVNRNLTEERIEHLGHHPDFEDSWWLQFLTYDWYKQDTTHGGVNFIKKEALPAIREHINEFKYNERPETSLYRIKPFHEPRRCHTVEKIVGIQNYGRESMHYVKETKERRGQIDNYDFALAKKLEQL